MLREVFTIPGDSATPDVQTAYSIILLLVLILKMKTTQSNETSHFTQSKVTISHNQSNKISPSNETSRCTRWPLSTMTHCALAHTS